MVCHKEYERHQICILIKDTVYWLANTCCGVKHDNRPAARIGLEFGHTLLGGSELTLLL